MTFSKPSVFWWLPYIKFAPATMKMTRLKVRMERILKSFMRNEYSIVNVHSLFKPLGTQLDSSEKLCFSKHFQFFFFFF